MVEFNAEVAINDIALNATPSGDESVRSSLDIAYSMGGGLSSEEKQAILDCFAHVAWVDPEGADYYQALYDLFFPPAELVRISAVYTQSGTVYPTTSLDSLKSDLVVKAHYSDGSAVTLSSSDYTLSGTLSVGTSTVAVSYSGKNTSFTVTVSAVPEVASISAVYTQSGTVYDTDSLDSLKDDLVVTATYTDSSTEIVPAADYTLSGTLAVGTSTVTVTYESKTTTFSVTVTQHSLLPEGYTQYDWIYNKTPAINTMIDTGLAGSYCSTDYAHELDFLPESGAASTSYAVYGCRQTSGSDPQARAYWAKTGNGGVQWACNYNGIDSGWTHMMTYGTRYDSVTAGGKWTVNGTDWETMSGTYTPPSPNIWLYGISTGGTTSYARLKHKIYKFKVWKVADNTPIAEFIPCTNASNVPGFYDIVREQFYTATTTGNLEAGNDT